MKHVLLSADLDRVARVVAALIADNHVGLFGQDVNDFAFAFIAPLGAYENRGSHNGTPQYPAAALLARNKLNSFPAAVFDSA